MLVVFVFVIIDYTTCRRILMEITGDVFKTIIEQYIVPLIPVADLKSKDNTGQQISRIVPIDKCPKRIAAKPKTVSLYKAYKKHYWYFCPRQKKPEYFYKLLLSCKVDNIAVMTGILNCVLSAVSRFQIGDREEIKYYLEPLCQAAVTLGISTHLTEGDKRFTLTKAIEALEYWSKRSYEGKKVPFGIIIDFDYNRKNKNPNFIDFLKSKYSASFTDGVFSAMLVDYKGCIIEHIALSTEDSIELEEKEIQTRDYPFTPTRFKSFSRLCDMNKVGLIALSNGDILIIKNKQLCFAKREGVWQAFDYSTYFRPCLENTLHFIETGTDPESKKATERISKTVYQSILDASFSHSGACIAIIDFIEDNKKKLDTVLHNCQITEDYDPSDKSITLTMREKQAVLRTLTQYSQTPGLFVDLSSKLRVELLSMDGAVILDNEGKVRAVGAILKIAPGSEEGGRFAAAKKLSYFGISFKVSEDGGITGLYKGKTVCKIG